MLLDSQEDQLNVHRADEVMVQKWAMTDGISFVVLERFAAHNVQLGVTLELTPLISATAPHSMNPITDALGDPNAEYR